MCGIAGIFLPDGGPAPPGEALSPALGRMRHRGPDGEGVVRLGSGVIGNRRLAVIDRDGGAQPMVSPDGRSALTLNGEIFDYSARRAELIREGAAFSTRSDTEVLLRLLARRGRETLPDLRGMFALAHLSGGGRNLLLARDPFGVKPLLWRRVGERGEIHFASEARALLAGEPGRPRIDRRALIERLAFQVPLADRTLLAGVRALAPGTALAAHGRSIRIHRFHEVTYEADGEGTEEDWARELAALIESAVRGALRADVPLGVTLSGGLDSTLVAALAARVHGPGLPAYTGYFEEGPAFDERPHARAAAAALGLRGVEVPIRPRDLLDRLAELAEILEGPVAGPGSLPGLLVAARASEEVTVVLNGQGADEVFGGYARHRIAWLEREGRLDPTALPPDLRSYEPLVRHHLAAGVGEPFEDRFFRLVFRGEGLGDLLGPALREEWRGYDARGAFREAFREEDGDPFHRMISYERRTLLPALLHVEDRVSMARSLESRVPLLDPGVVALSARIPSRIAFGDGRLKHILRVAARDLVPRSVLARRDKMGFPVPLGAWARGPLEGAFREILSEGPLVREGILAPGAPERLVRGAGSHGRHLWFFLLLSEWMRATGAAL